MAQAFLVGRYNTSTTVYFTILKTGVSDFATNADWTPATGDTKIGGDGQNPQTTTNNPVWVGNGIWGLVLTREEMSASGQTVITIIDSAVKAVQDTSLFMQVLLPEAFDATYVIGGVSTIGTTQFVPAPLLSEIKGPQAFNSDATTHNVAMPTSVQPGDLLLVLFANDGNAAVTTPTGWTQLGNAANSTIVRYGVYAKIAVGSEGGTNVNFVTGSSEQAQSIIYRVAAGTWYPDLVSGISITSSTTGNDTSPGAATVTVPWQKLNTLSFITFASDDQVSVTAYPIFFNNLTWGNGNTTGVTLGSTSQVTNISNPGNGSPFTISGAQEWVAFNICVRPWRVGDPMVLTHRGTATAGAAGSITLAATAVATDSYYTDQRITIIGGTGIGQSRRCTGYTGSTKVATVAPNWTTTVDSTSQYVVEPFTRVNLAEWLGSVPNALTSGRVDVSVGAMASGVIAAATFAANALDAVWSTTTRTLSAFGFSVTVGTNSDKTGYALTSAYDPAKTASQAGDVMKVSTGTGANQLDVTSGVIKANLAQILGTAFTEGAGGRIAAAFKQFFNIASPAATMDHGVLVDTVTTATTATNLTNAPTSGDLTATMKTSVTTAATAATPTVTAGTVSDKTGYALSSGGVQAIWDALTSALTTSGSIGKLLVDNINASISAIKTVTDKFAFTVTNQVDANVLDWKSSTAPAMTGDAYARLGAPAGASVSADIAAVDSLSTTIEGETAAIKIKTDQLDFLADGALRAISAIHAGTAQAGTSTTITLDTGASSVNNFYVNYLAYIASGTGAGQVRPIRAYVGSTRVATIASSSYGYWKDWETTPDNTSTVVLLPPGMVTADMQFNEKFTQDGVNNLLTRVPAALVSGRMDSSVGAYQSGLAPDNSSITAIKAKTDNLPSSPAATGDAMTLATDALDSDALATSAVTEIQSGLATASSISALNDLSAAEVRTQADDALAAYDGPTHAELTSEINDVQTDIAGLNIPTADENADALLDRADGVEAGISLREAQRLELSAMAGKVSGAGTTDITFRDANDTKDRIVATVDANGNRTDVTLDAS